VTDRAAAVPGEWWRPCPRPATLGKIPATEAAEVLDYGSVASLPGLWLAVAAASVTRQDAGTPVLLAASRPRKQNGERRGIVTHTDVGGRARPAVGAGPPRVDHRRWHCRSNRDPPNR
jgi:hypothetical protein